ncbi:MAG: phosphotransferase family protein [Xanthomonadales bacterium]|nr:phosphotransferase family protein [Xanthomonadales bacterium]
MSGSGPRQADPEAVLAALGGYAGAAVRRQLSDGPTNASFHIEHGGRAYVLRIDKPEAERLGLDRAREDHLARAAAAAGLASEILYSDPGQGILLREYLPGRSWTGQDLQDPRNLALLAGRLRQLHALEVEARPFEPAEAARRYAEHLGTLEAQRLFEQLERHAAFMGAPIVLAPCHNDLLAQNILEVEPGESGPGESDLFLIDWEYAAPGDPWFDLAIVISHHDLPEDLAAAFIEAYLDRPPTPAERTRLQQQCRFYQLLLALWKLRVGG